MRIFIQFQQKFAQSQMTEMGYDKDRFIKLDSENFDCPICTMVAKNPKDCTSCGSIFCSTCIDDWMKKKNECPNRCPKDAKIQLIQRALKKIYGDLEIKCEFCNKPFKMVDLEQHEKLCNLPKCVFYDICNNQIGNESDLKGAKVCDNVCLLLSRIKPIGTNKEQLYQVIKTFVKEKQLGAGPLSQPIMNQPALQQSSLAGTLKWDRQRMGTGIQLTDNDTVLFLKEQAYMFRSVVGEQGFMGGVNYWEIQADERTENELKIGVTTKRDFNCNTAFCDFDYGWAYYGLGQLRHNSNATGPSFGKRFKKDGSLGICLNMNKGTLSFSLNGEFMGVAFTDPNLKKGPIYPAVSLLHCAGCKIVSGKPLPACFSNA